MKSGYQFCNNCGKNGHIFQQCIHPIISNGIIACRKNRLEKKSLPLNEIILIKFPPA